jgi:transposase
MTETTTLEATREVAVLEPERVQQIVVLAGLGWGARRIAADLGLARNTVRDYVRGKRVPGVQTRLKGRKLSVDEVAKAQALFREAAEGNAVVVADLLKSKDPVSVRTVQRAVAPVRQTERAAAVATVRFETPPGEQMQIDFGERWVTIGGESSVVYFFVATLGYSRRIYVRASLSQRQDEWRLGIEGALQHFGGRPEQLLLDNARALVLHHTESEVKVNPVFAAFCLDRGLAVQACQPYRPRTKGKVENGVKYVKRNAIAGRHFADLQAIQTHLEAWMLKADHRIHGTTHRRPIDLFVEHEAQALRPLHSASLPVVGQRLRRKVANDCYVDLDTNRYSVPSRLAREMMEVQQTDSEVIIWHRGVEVARHRRGQQRHQRISNPEHFKGLLRLAKEPELTVVTDQVAEPASSLTSYGRSLQDYADVVEASR